MMCVSSTKKTYALNQLNDMVEVKLNTWSGSFKLLYSTLHVFTCWKKNPITSSKKSISLLTLTIIISLLLGVIIIDKFKVANKDTDKYQGFRTQISFKNYIFFCTLFILFFNELLKVLFLQSPNQVGMVKLEEEAGSELGQQEVPQERKRSDPSDAFTSKQQIQEINDIVNSALQSSRTGGISSSRNSSSLSSQRQLNSQREENFQGVRGRQVVEINIKEPLEKISEVDENPNPQEQNQQEGVLLAAEDFEEPKSYSRPKVIIGTILIMAILLFCFIDILSKLNKINLYAIFISLLYTGVSLCLCILMVHPIMLLIMSKII